MAMMLHRIFAIFILTTFWGIQELFHARQEFVCRNTVAAVVSQRRKFGSRLEWGSDVGHGDLILHRPLRLYERQLSGAGQRRGSFPI